MPMIDFALVKRAAQPKLLGLLMTWAPTGRQQGQEWVLTNPRRSDSRLGSFKINLRTGRWADFATGDKGGDVISLLAYLKGISQSEAARLLAHELGLEP
jgi:hypothetical protein